MIDTAMARLNEGTIVIYALSVLFYFIDFLQHNRKAGKMAFWLLSIVWTLQTVYLAYFMWVTGRFPVLNVTEALYFYAWVLVTLSLVLTKLLRVDFIVFFTNVIGFSMIAIHTFSPTEQQSAAFSGQLVSEPFGDSYYNGDSFIRRFFPFFRFFCAIYVSISSAEKEKVGKMAVENRRFI